jgi:hypothetical protein
MRTFTTVALGLLSAAVASASDVSSLTKDTFTDFVTENDLVLAECESPATAWYLVHHGSCISLTDTLFRSLRSMCIHDSVIALTLLTGVSTTQPWW